MWTIATTTIEKDRVYKYEILENEQYLTFADFLQGLCSDTTFRKNFNELLANVPFEAFFWECRAVNKGRLGDTFECVAIKGPTLAQIAEDSSPFHTHFKSKKQAVTFENLGKDAYLIAPTPQSSGCYAHLADFIRKAPEQQQDAFWKLVGETCSKQLDTKRHWWSTSGLGVHWLHLRIDTFPKYYQYSPYRNEAW